MSLSHSDLQPPVLLGDIPMVDSEKTLSDFSTIQQRILKATNNTTNDNIICVEKTTTHHNYYDVEKMGEDTARNSAIEYPTVINSTSRPFGMGNPGIIGNHLL